jgi:release factor glutamine methyltransferase
VTIGEALKEGSSVLASALSIKTETPSLDARLLLAETLRTEASKLLIIAKDDLSETQYFCYKKLLARRLEGECVAYILERKEFFGLEFYVNPSVLVPRPDTETLVEAGLVFLRDWGTRGLGDWGRTLRVLDLCTGSGAVAIALKYEMPELEVWASDISAEALAIAKKNSNRLLTGKIQDNGPHGDPITFVESEKRKKIEGLFHLIVANPPYVCSGEIDSLAPEVRGEPKLALDGGQDGLDLIKKIISCAPRYLYPDGILLMEMDASQTPAVRTFFQNHSFGNIKIYKDMAGKDRVMSGIYHRYS